MNFSVRMYVEVYEVGGGYKGGECKERGGGIDRTIEHLINNGYWLGYSFLNTYQY